MYLKFTMHITSIRFDCCWFFFPFFFCVQKNKGEQKIFTHTMAFKAIRSQCTTTYTQNTHLNFKKNKSIPLLTFSQVNNQYLFVAATLDSYYGLTLTSLSRLDIVIIIMMPAFLAPSKYSSKVLCYKILYLEVSLQTKPHTYRKKKSPFLFEPIINMIITIIFLQRLLQVRSLRKIVFFFLLLIFLHKTLHYIIMKL